MDAMAKDNYAVRAKNLSKRFGSVEALRDINFGLERKDLLVLIGSNGAGKSTLLKTAAGLYRPSRGRIEVLGKDAYAHNPDVLRRISFLGENYALYDNLTVKDNLRFFSRMYGIEAGRAEEAYMELLAKLSATEYLNRKVSQLSRGTKQKVAICRALINTPEVLFLDEPTAFLDADSSFAIQNLLSEKSSEGVAIIYATQRLEEINSIGTRFAVMSSGRLKYFGSREEIVMRLGNVELEIELLTPPSSKLISALSEELGRGFRMGGRRNIITVSGVGLHDIPGITELVISKGGKVIGVDYLKKALLEVK
jgi:ABC-type multidrug transport system ATPase subunit